MSEILGDRVQAKRKTSQYRRALAELTDMCGGGILPIDARLPAERDLAVQLRVGRSTLRKALATLEAEGKIWRNIGQGTFIGPRPPIGGSPVLPTTVAASPRELLDARMMFEPMIAATAAGSATDIDIQNMQRCVEKGERARTWEIYEEWDRAFHHAIAMATHNALAVAFMDMVNEARRRDTWTRDLLPPVHSKRADRSRSLHRTVLEAIQLRDGKRAAEQMREHLRMVQRNYFEKLVTGL